MLGAKKTIRLPPVSSITLNRLSVLLQEYMYIKGELDQLLIWPKFMGAISWHTLNYIQWVIP